MVRTVLAAVIFSSAPALAQTQSASAPLVVTATVISTCKVDVPNRVEPSLLSTLPVALKCARRGADARVQRPQAPRRSEVRDAVLMINF